MLYTDVDFLVVLALVWGVTKALRPWPAVKEWFLIAFSLLVIATWGYLDVGLFVGILAVNYLAIHAMKRTANPLAERALFYGTIVFDLGVLVLFKYANFIGGNIGSVSGLNIPKFPLGIPLAVSFYTFHLISYLVDVRAGKVQMAGIRQYTFYLSFFPHVIAGPIVRAWQLFGQIGRNRRGRNDLLMGVHFLVTGFFLKMVIANNISNGIDSVWNDGGAPRLSGWEHITVAFLYYCQIYGDFAGYTLMALGMSRLLGYRLPVNFRSPMRAATMQEFWQRWHITLSRWLRDYLYIPLGGGRVSKLRASANVMITMLLGGLWHGASWGFVAWGGLQGLGIVAERYLGFRKVPVGGVRWYFWWFVTQVWVTIAWVFFRSPNFSDAVKFIRYTFPLGTHHGGKLMHASYLTLLIFAAFVVIHNWMPLLLQRIPRRRLGAFLGLLTGVMLVLNFLIASPAKVFIYFKF